MSGAHVLLAVLLAAPVQESGRLFLQDRRLTAGTQIPLDGSGFAADRRLRLSLVGIRDTVELGAVAAGTDGTFRHTLDVPRTIPAGAYRLVAGTGNAEITALDVAVLGDTARSSAAAAAPAAGHDATDSSTNSAADSAPASDTVVLGYDWPQLHAALNDLPAALLLFAVVFQLAGVLTRKSSLRAAGFWTLLAGTGGALAAVIAGLMAENVVGHDDVAHAVMQRHKTLALITVAVFAILAAWAVLRRKADGRPEQLLWSAAGMAGVFLLVMTSNLGGSLVFDHALGVPSPALRAVLERRGDMPAMGPPDPARSDSTVPGSGGGPHREHHGGVTEIRR